MSGAPTEGMGNKFEWFHDLFPRASEPETGDEAKRELCVHDGKKPVVIVSILAVEQDMIDEIIEVILKKFTKGHRIVFVTDCADFSSFMKNKVAFEYLPAHLVQKLHSDTLSWRIYLQERWDLLLTKWKPSHILSYGQNAQRFIQNAPDIEFPK